MEYLLIHPYMPVKKVLEKCKNIVLFAYIFIEPTLRLAPNWNLLIPELPKPFILTIVSHAILENEKFFHIQSRAWGWGRGGSNGSSSSVFWEQR